MRTMMWVGLGVLAVGAGALAGLAQWLGGLDDPADLLYAEGWERGPEPLPETGRHRARP